MCGATAHVLQDAAFLLHMPAGHAAACMFSQLAQVIGLVGWQKLVNFFFFMGCVTSAGLHHRPVHQAKAQ